MNTYKRKNRLSQSNASSDISFIAFICYIFQVGNPNASVILETKLGERALLIKNTDGDWGIVKGYWAGFRKEKLGKGTILLDPTHFKICVVIEFSLN